jgi:hypothetical protein
MNEAGRHFAGKSIDKHILERFSQGISISQEPHGIEASGAKISFADSFKSSILILALFVLQTSCNVSSVLLLSFCCALIFSSRAAWTSWARLEKLHRMLREESYEIENHREQERLELKELYQLKGFEEPLLSQVIEVLMSDSDRLLKVMLEEELGLSLGSHEHPLKIALYSFCGSFIAGIFLTLGWQLAPNFLTAFASLLFGLSASLYAFYLGNQKLQSFVWNVATCSCILIIFQQLNSLILF